MIGPLTSDDCCISTPIALAVVSDISGISGVGGAIANNIVHRKQSESHGNNKPFKNI